MVELVSYGLTGLATVVVIASWLAFSDDCSRYPHFAERGHRAVYENLTIK